MGIEKSSKTIRPDVARWIVLILLSVIISVVIYPDVLLKPKSYKLGDIAEADIKASKDFLIQNKERTERDREEAIKKVPYVYDFDASASNLVLRIREAMANARKSISTEAVDQSAPVPIDKIPTETSDDTETAADNFFSMLDLPYNADLYNKLSKLGFPKTLENAIISLVSNVFSRGIVGNRVVLLSQSQKGIVLQSIQDQQEIPVKDLTRFFDIESAKKSIEARKDSLIKGDVTPEIADLAVDLAVSLIKPNVTFNKRETELKKDQAAKSVKPSYYQIKRGEMLVREGERIGPEHLVKLAAEAKAFHDQAVLGRIPGMAVLIGIFLSTIYIAGFMKFKPLGEETKHLIFSSLTLLGTFLFVWAFNFIAEEVARGFSSFTTRAILFSLPVTFGAILITVFQGMNMAVIFSLLISIFSSFVFNGNEQFLIYFFVSSLYASYLVREYRERGILIKIGFKVGLLNIILCLSIESIHGAFFSFEALLAIISGFLGGVLAGVISTGIIPLVEMAFGFTTDIKLLELANLDQPLLRDLMVQAPGTYHHSVIVSNMVEATAKAINANPLLAKVSAYYHDIGKMKKPLYFIENQMGGENRHEKLAPSMSSLVLISHVKDGVELARKHKLGQEIIDIIQQHQGKGLITYFYEKAREQAASKKGGKSIDVKEEDFRYPGPKPQTKEAGLVMLADMVEAASRSLSDPTPARIQGTVQKIINRVFSDGQLDECELTLKDLNEIAKSFNKTLSGIFHQRVEYPEINHSKNIKKTANGDSDQISQEDSRAKKSEDKISNGESLKRLGL